MLREFLKIELNKKTANYLTLFLGLIICLITFFLFIEGFRFTASIFLTEFSYTLVSLRREFDLDIFEKGRRSIEIKIIWTILLVAFLYYWWRLRDKISSFLIKIHKRI